MSDGTLVPLPKTGSDGYTDWRFSSNPGLDSIILRKPGYETKVFK
jgi:hypothetical protein